MTTEQREELLALVDALPEERRQWLLARLRGGAAPSRRPLSPLGPLPADDADAILRVVAEGREGSSHASRDALPGLGQSLEAALASLPEAAATALLSGLREGTERALRNWSPAIGAMSDEDAQEMMRFIDEAFGQVVDDDLEWLVGAFSGLADPPGE
jgi:hypothetical protein